MLQLDALIYQVVLMHDRKRIDKYFFGHEVYSYISFWYIYLKYSFEPHYPITRNNKKKYHLFQWYFFCSNGMFYPFATLNFQSRYAFFHSLYFLLLKIREAPFFIMISLFVNERTHSKLSKYER